MNIIVRDATIVNEGVAFIADILISNDRIEKIASKITSPKEGNYQEINAAGLYLLPGVIDDQVHFREPGHTHKADIISESNSATFLSCHARALSSGKNKPGENSRKNESQWG